MSKSSAQARRELVQAIRERYLAATKDEKSRVLDEFVALTGYYRKHALRVMHAQLDAAASCRGMEPTQRFRS